STSSGTSPRGAEEVDNVTWREIRWRSDAHDCLTSGLPFLQDLNHNESYDRLQDNEAVSFRQFQ
ncbi:MAG: hypothetical protein WBW14_22955, partial [Candidatus Acidiferrum sp.]